MNSESSRQRVSLNKADYGIQRKVPTLTEEERESLLSKKEELLNQAELVLAKKEKDLEERESEILRSKQSLEELKAELLDYKEELDKLPEENIQKLETEKRYKVLKIEHYNEELRYAERDTKIWTFLTGYASISLVLNQLLPNVVCNIVFGAILAGTTTFSLRLMIDAISRKTNIKQQIDSLNCDVNQIDSEIKKLW